MAAPSFSGGFSSLSGSYTAAPATQVPAADLNAKAPVGFSSISGGDEFRVQNSATGNAQLVQGEITFTAQDVSDSETLMAFEVTPDTVGTRLGSYGDVNSANGGAILTLRDSSDNYKGFIIGGNNQELDAVENGTDPGFYFIDPSATSTIWSTGTLDNADIDAVSVAIFIDDSENTVRIEVDNFGLVTPIVSTQGDSGDPITFAKIGAFAAGQTIAAIKSLGTTAISTATTIKIGDGGATTTYMRDSSRAVEMRANQAVNALDQARHWNSADNFLGFEFDVTSDFDIEVTNTTFASSTPWRLLVTPNGNTSENLIFRNNTVSGAGLVTLDAPFDGRGCSFTGCAEITPNAADLTNATISNSTNATGAIVWDSNATLTGLTFSGNTEDIRIPVGAPASITFTNITESANALTVRDERTGSPEIIVSGGATPTVTNTVGGVTTSVVASNTLTLTGIETGSQVRFHTGAQGASAVDIGGVASSSGDVVLSHSSAGVAGFVTVFKTGYVPLVLSVTYASGAVSQGVEQAIDRAYANAA